MRISDRLDGNPSRAHSDYATPQAHDIQWLIGAPGNVIRFIYEDPRHEGRIRVKKLQATPAFLDSLTSIQRNYYFVMADPPWVSTVSLWTPQGANIIYVYGLQPLSLKDKEGNFVYPAPTGLRSLAQMAGTPFGNKAQSFLHRRQEPR